MTEHSCRLALDYYSEGVRFDSWLGYWVFFYVYRGITQ
jgi:hypothetical protein